jgi:GNAT superfamily N-acetyltransferase
MPSTRPARPSDLPQILAMVEALARHHGDEPRLSLAALDADVFGTPPWLRILVAEVDDALVGFAALQPLSQLQFGQRGMDLHHLYVEPHLRGCGIGRALVAASIDYARALRCQFLAVGTHPDNAAAQAFYLAFGFEARPNVSPRFGLRL